MADKSRRLSRDPRARRERDDIHESVVSVMRATRQDKDMSQISLAKLMGWSTKTPVVNLENHRREADLADFILMVEKMELDPEEVFAAIMFHLRQRRRRARNTRK